MLRQNTTVVIGSLTKEYLDYTKSFNICSNIKPTIQGDSKDKINCYFGELARVDMENVLNDKPNGSFLVRDGHGPYHEVIKVISVSWLNSIKQYKILDEKDGYFSCAGKSFTTVDALLEHFMTHPLTHEGVVLKVPIPCPTQFSNNSQTSKSHKIEKLESKIADRKKTIEILKESSETGCAKARRKKSLSLSKEQKAVEKLNMQLKREMDKVIESPMAIQEAEATEPESEEKVTLPASIERKGSIIVNDKITSIQNSIAKEMAAQNKCEKVLNDPSLSEAKKQLELKNLQHHKDSIMRLTGDLNEERSKEVKKQRNRRLSQGAKSAKSSSSITAPTQTSEATEAEVPQLLNEKDLYSSMIRFYICRVISPKR